LYDPGVDKEELEILDRIMKNEEGIKR